VDQPVVADHRPNPGQAVLLLGGEEVCVDQAETTKPGLGKGFDSLAKREWASFVAAQGRCVAGGRPTCGQEGLVAHWVSDQVSWTAEIRGRGWKPAVR
jgi:hypothetical protein